MPFYLAVSTTGWYRKGCTFELVWSLLPLITVEGFANRFYLCEQYLFRRSMGSQVMHRIDKVLSA